jgi:hypothetical protein
LQALRDTEARACAGLSEDDRDISPFEHREDVASVEPFYASTSSSKGGAQSRLAGAIVTFRALPGMTAEWLQRVIDCHLERNAAIGHEAPDMPWCPLLPKGVTATVASTGAGFAVVIRSEDTDTANEILRRARTLIAP